MGTVVLILIQDPGIIAAARSRRPYKIRAYAGGQGFGGGGFIHQPHLFLLVGKTGVVRGFGLPLPVQPGGPAEFLRLVVQLENPLGEAMEHGFVVRNDAALHASQAGRQVHITGPLCPQRKGAQQQGNAQEQTGNPTHPYFSSAIICTSLCGNGMVMPFSFRIL